MPVIKEEGRRQRGKTWLPSLVPAYRVCYIIYADPLVTETFLLWPWYRIWYSRWSNTGCYPWSRTGALAMISFLTVTLLSLFSSHLHRSDLQVLVVKEKSQVGGRIPSMFPRSPSGMKSSQQRKRKRLAADGAVNQQWPKSGSETS